MNNVEKIRKLLIDANYHLLWDMRKEILDNFIDRFRLECWVGTKGVLIIQIFTHLKGDNSISIYCDSGIPVEWDKLEKWLTTS